jgi:hypothetical protein
MAVSRWRDEDINGTDPPLTAVGTAYPTPPFLPVLHPLIELAGSRPRGRLHLYRRIDLSAIRFGTLLHRVVAEIHAFGFPRACGVILVMAGGVVRDRPIATSAYRRALRRSLDSAPAQAL